MPEAAEILYDILNEITVLDNRTPILVVCNKSDLQFSRKPVQIESEIEKEIEELRKVRKATMDDQDTAKEQVSQMGFLETLSKRFSFNDNTIKGQLPEIRFVDCSVKKEDLKHVYAFLKQMF